MKPVLREIALVALWIVLGCLFLLIAAGMLQLSEVLL